MEFLFTNIGIGLMLGLAVIWLFENQEHNVALQLKSQKVKALQEQMQQIAQWHAASTPPDPIRATTHEWMYTFVKSGTQHGLRALEPLIQKICAHYKEIYGLQSQFTTDFPVKQDTNLTALQAWHICTIFDEGLHNAAVHAQARYVFAIASFKDGVLAFIVHDNGVGYDTRITVQGAGMKRIKQATDALKGTLFLTSTPGNGTVVNVEVPQPFKPF